MVSLLSEGPGPARGRAGRLLDRGGAAAVADPLAVLAPAVRGVALAVGVVVGAAQAPAVLVVDEAVALVAGEVEQAVGVELVVVALVVHLGISYEVVVISARRRSRCRRRVRGPSPRCCGGRAGR